MFFRQGFRSTARASARYFSATSQGCVQRVSNASQSRNLVALGAFAAAAGTVFAVSELSRAAECASDLQAAKKELIAMIEKHDEKVGDGTSIAPTLVRLAWHASGTYSAADKTGGSNGATMRFAPEAEWGANAGLKAARDFLAPLKQKYNLSFADTWTLAGAVAIEQMGGPKVPWRSGRIDSDVPTRVPDGRLPAADKGCPNTNVAHIRQIFGRMGFSDREMVALIGAHAVGRCHENASGYWGPWTRAETTFSNEYFRLLLQERWTLKRTHNGKPWKGPVQFESADGSLMMLPNDIALIQDSEFRKYVELYAKDEDLFFKDFAAAFSKLLELGVSFPMWGGQSL